MGEFDTADADAALETDVELQGYLAEVLGMDATRLKAAFPSTLDQEIVRSLIARVDQSTTKIELLQMWKDAGKCLTEGGIKTATLAFKVAKSALLSVVLALCAWPASAGVLDLGGPLDWIEAHANESRYGLAVNFATKVGVAANLPLMWDAQKNYWDLNVGYTHFEGGIDHATIGLGVNIVTTTHDIWKRILGKRVAVMPLGDLWLGPYIESPPLDNIGGRWDIGERTGIQFVYKLFK